VRLPAVRPANRVRCHASPGSLPDFADLVEKVGPAVVNIRTTANVPVPGPRGSLPPGFDNGDMSEFFRRFFGIPLPQAPGNGGGSPKGAPTPDNPPDTEQNRGVGSGFIVSADGYVMTNAHVVDDADTIYVTLTDKREFKAKLIGVDKRPTWRWSRSRQRTCRSSRSAIRQGARRRVGVAIGSPFGLDNTVTAGIVRRRAATRATTCRSSRPTWPNPGNSGGPLINMQRRGDRHQLADLQPHRRLHGHLVRDSDRRGDARGRSAEGDRQGHARPHRVAIGEVTKDVADSIGLPKAKARW
jgi:serine protease Do